MSTSIGPSALPCNLLSAAESTPIFYSKSDFITTKQGNKISRSCVLKGSDKIIVAGKTIIEAGCELHGDLAAINIGRFCILGHNVVLRPPEHVFQGRSSFVPMQIGEHVTIEHHSVLEAAQVGSYVFIGPRCVIGKRCVLSDCCMLLEGTHLAPGSVVPPFAIMGGSPGKLVGKLPESFQEQCTELTGIYYKQFRRQPDATK
jgi:dynactin-5